MKDLELLLKYTKDIEILYVEDDDFIRSSTKELLDIYFKSVDIATDGEDGLNKYRAFKEKNSCFYDIVISDVSMPKICGLDMSEMMLKLNAFQSIILITAFEDVELLHRAIDLSISGYLKKPIDITKLEKVLYKTSQSISDRKFVESHVELIENISLRLESRIEKLSQENEELKKNSCVVLPTENESIIQIKEFNANKISAIEYCADMELDSELLEELNDAAELALNALFMQENLSDKIVKDVIQALNMYSSLFHSSIVFTGVEEGFVDLIVALEANPIDNLEYPLQISLSKFLSGLIDDLISWKNHIYILQDAPDIHYLDDSMIFNCKDIVRMINGDDISTDEDDLEFF